MGFLDNIFGKKPVDEGERLKQAEEYLAEMERLMRDSGDFKQPLKLYRKSKKFDDMIDEGGPLHDRFFAVAFAIVSGEQKKENLPVLSDPSPVRDLLASRQVLTWDDDLVDHATLCLRAEASNSELIWVTDPNLEKKHADPLKKIRAAYIFAASPNIPLLFMDEGIPMIIRRSFLQAACGEISGEYQIEDVGQELTDLAHKKGLEAINTWGR